MKIEILSRHLLAGVLLLSASGIQAATLNNTVIVQDGMTMTWDNELSTISSTTQNGDVTNFMGSDSISMMVSGSQVPVWDYSWNMSAAADPFIAGTFTVTNTSSMMQTFDITFGLPIAPSFTNGYMRMRMAAAVRH